MTERRTALLSAALAALGPASLSVYTPAMPTLVEVFGTTPSSVQLTLTAYLVGFSLVQLLCGPLSDAYGRRPVAVAFISLYLAASLSAVAARSVEWLILSRALQGAGAAVGVTLSRAIVRDLYTRQTSARIMNLSSLMVGLGPAAAPTIGGLTLEALGWSEIFVLMALFGGLVMAAVLWLLPETNLLPDRNAARPLRLARNYGRLIVDRRFLRPSIVIGLTVGSFFTMATIMPFVLIGEVGLTPLHFGFAMLLQSGSFILGTVITGRLLRRFEASRLVPPGLVLILGAGLALFALTATAGPSLPAVMGPLMLFGASVALLMPSLQTAGVAPFGAMAGAASALMGFLQMGLGLVGSFAASLVPDPVLALMLIVPAMHVTAGLVYWLLRPKAPRAPVAGGGAVGQPAE